MSNKPEQDQCFDMVPGEGFEPPTFGLQNHGITKSDCTEESNFNALLRETIPQKTRPTRISASNVGTQVGTSEGVDQVAQINRLVGKGGLGLAMFHLARHKLDFEQTSPDSPNGDLWVKAHNEIVPVEVKTSTSRQWRVRFRQIQAVRVFIFVSYETSECWLVSSADVMKISQRATKIGPDVFLVSSRHFERDSCHGWSRFSQIAGIDGAPTHQNIGRLYALSSDFRDNLRPKAKYRHMKTIKKVLASGETKIYRYPRDR